ncbi:MAG: hypothetical protein IPP35_07390 [Elusimicrobia bacterium]|nr:hypothetical protein [Elusimicrobiota bacterium]
MTSFGDLDLEHVEDPGLDQALRIARTTTFEQRFGWLETTIEAFRPQLRDNYDKQKSAGLIPSWEH